MELEGEEAALQQLWLEAELVQSTYQLLLRRHGCVERPESITCWDVK